LIIYHSLIDCSGVPGYPGALCRKGFFWVLRTICLTQDLDEGVGVVGADQGAGIFDALLDEGTGILVGLLELVNQGLLGFFAADGYFFQTKGVVAEGDIEFFRVGHM
jgi:hypothetical protein